MSHDPPTKLSQFRFGSSSSSIKNSKVNDWVEIFGKNISISDFATKLLCLPLKSTLNFADGKLTTPLGTHHGVGVNSLAVASGTDTPWQILRVSAASPMTSTLTPLNSQRDAAGLAGQVIEFMELN